jgi:hypothetical protein
VQKPLPEAASSAKNLREIQNAPTGRATADSSQQTANGRFFETTRTPFMDRSRMPLGEMFGSHAQVNFDIDTTHNRNLIAGPLAPPVTSEMAFAQERSNETYGVSLSVPLGRSAGSNSSPSMLHTLSHAWHARK